MQDIIPSGLLLLIGILYFIFVFQLWAQVHSSAYKNKDTRAITALMIVFAFCAIAGYLSDIIPFPSWMEVGFHIILAVISGYLVLTNRAGDIADGLNRKGFEADIYRRSTDKRAVIWSNYLKKDEEK